jgi:hypothetical protein
MNPVTRKSSRAWRFTPFCSSPARGENHRASGTRAFPDSPGSSLLLVGLAPKNMGGIAPGYRMDLLGHRRGANCPGPSGGSAGLGSVESVLAGALRAPTVIGVG